MAADSSPAGRLIAEVVTESKPGAALLVQRLVLTPEGRRGLTVGGGVLPNGDIRLVIPPADRPYCDGPAVLNYYDGPLLMVLASPLWGDLLALAVPDEAGSWPFLLAPITAVQLEALRAHLRLPYGAPRPPGGVREHFLGAANAYLLRDYGAQDLVASPVAHPLPEDWLPSSGY